MWNIGNESISINRKGATEPPSKATREPKHIPGEPGRPEALRLIDQQMTNKGGGTDEHGRQAQECP